MGDQDAMDEEPMGKVNLLLSDELGTDLLEELRAGLNETLPIGEAHQYLRLSGDPGLTPFIQLIGDAASWWPLKAAATVYLGVLAKDAAVATKDWLRARLKKEDVRPLASVAAELEATASKVGGRVEFVVSLNVPDNHWGTSMPMRAGEPEETARRLATFVVHAEAISDLMQKEVEAGRSPATGAVIELREDGSLLIKWRACDDLEVHVRKVG